MELKFKKNLKTIFIYKQKIIKNVYFFLILNFILFYNFIIILKELNNVGDSNNNNHMQVPI